MTIPQPFVWFRSSKLKHYLHGSAERVFRCHLGADGVQTAVTKQSRVVRDWLAVEAQTPSQEAEDSPCVGPREPGMQGAVKTPGLHQSLPEDPEVTALPPHHGRTLEGFPEIHSR